MLNLRRWLLELLRLVSKIAALVLCSSGQKKKKTTEARLGISPHGNLRIALQEA
jgi:hypothetical protein